jgi:chemotaxis protein MotB
VPLVAGPVQKLSDQIATLRVTLANAQAEQKRVLASAAGNNAQSTIEALTNQNIAELHRQVAGLEETLAVAEAKEKSSLERIDDLSQRLNIALSARASDLSQRRSQFFRSLRTALGNAPDMRIVGDRFVIQADNLFDAGSGSLWPSARPTLNTLATLLIDLPSKVPADVAWILRVDGHVDAQPGALGQFRSKLDLSSARATAIVQYLIDKGVPPLRLAAVGFGDFQPIDPDTGDDAFRRNRRIELKLTER